MTAAVSAPALLLTNYDRFRIEMSPPRIGAIIRAAALPRPRDDRVGGDPSQSRDAPRDTSFVLVLLSGLYLVLVALASYGLGGYVAGRTRRRMEPGEFVECDDGMHGLIVWGVATILAGFWRQ
jgi:hypothetical protein